MRMRPEDTQRLRRLVGVLVVVGLVAALVAAFAWPNGTRPQRLAVFAQEATPAATPSAEQQLSDLQTRVAVLSTQVADLGGADPEEIAGRLGGRRAGFDHFYGAPTAFPAPDQVEYHVPDVGRLLVTFDNDRAVALTALPNRKPDLPLDQPDPADWSLDTARQMIARFSPADATFAGQQQTGPTMLVVPGSSEHLSAAVVPPDLSGCTAGGAASFEAQVTTPTANTASSVSIRLTQPPSTLPAAKPQRPKVNRGGGAVANSSLGGVVNVNGIRVQAQQVRPNATGTRAPAEGNTLIGIQVTIDNQSNRPLDFALTDFALADARGREVAPICGGVEPAIVPGELKPGETAEGWITFQAPSNFVPAKFMFYPSGATIGFTLR
jgi:Domain of unknown function (DUF4352)